MVSTTAPAKRDCSVFPWIVLGVFSILAIFLMFAIGHSFYSKRKLNANKEKLEKKESTTTTDVGATENQ
ncbi:hypothetical protein CAEBREN_10389 [Caenorhabditis brenneri]|uniref:Uncharacterized protein n=1 Tax=Caenorhabditis brenneri TaxID=135651 RepID=G0MDJ5_CAEBE|nr:hypothetical protein CAEBREN_10389 [Caenorhabditis brenneri]